MRSRCKTLRTSALALCYSVAEYSAPGWRNSAHTNLVDVQLNNTMRTITGAVRCTMTDWLPVLSNIAPADIRRKVATSRTILRARGKPELPLLNDIDFHPWPRLKSRRPIWSNLPDEAQTIQHLWRIRWQNQIVDVPNKSLINDPTIQLPGMDLPRGQWSLLNRFRSDAGPCRNSMHEGVTSPRHSSTAVNTEQWGILWMSARWIASTAASQNYTKYMMRPSPGCWDNIRDRESKRQQQLGCRQASAGYWIVTDASTSAQPSDGRTKAWWPPRDTTSRWCGVVAGSWNRCQRSSCYGPRLAAVRQGRAKSRCAEAQLQWQWLSCCRATGSQDYASARPR